ncbi:unnamed protein product [Echinostoma caproni]|uniref:VWFA domain-containing protein n=1 Tax=Echinostoma caproni TaxID=27848 RepID=A0A3P8J2X7_9TREM|nr:unnamed protein product [Echinostoma caproni]
MQLYLNKSQKHPREERAKPYTQWANVNAQPSSARSKTDEFITTKHQHYHTLSAVRSQDLRAEDASRQTSEEWLANHGLVALNLTARDLVAMGRIVSPDTETSTPERLRMGDKMTVQQDLKRNPPEALEYDLETVTEYECKLHSAMANYTLRIKWLMQSSRRVFGVIKGEHIGLLLDASHMNLGYGRDRLYRDYLIQLIDEQLAAKHIQTVFVATYGTQTSMLWPVPMTVNGRVLEELKTFVREEMKPSGSSNLLDGIKKFPLCNFRYNSVTPIFAAGSNKKPEMKRADSLKLISFSGPLYPQIFGG